jgi:hypothetical protein
MTPRDFLANVVEPNVVELAANFGSVRCAYNAVAAVDALAAHIFHWVANQDPASIAGMKDDTAYREALAEAYPVFGVLRDLAKALKM